MLNSFEGVNILNDRELMLTVRIFRTDEQGAGYWATYQVSVDEKMSVLDVITKIQRKEDPTLAYRYSCRAGMCGTCAMRVNGKNRWTCRTQVANLKSGTLTIEPLPHFPVLRDLAVDMEPFFERHRKIVDRFVPVEPDRKGFAVIPQLSRERREINEHVECITCGSCFASCGVVNSSSEYLGPAALNRAWVLIADSRDAAGGERLDILNSRDGVWSCHTQFNCSDACPVGLSPARAIQKLKRKEVRHAFSRIFSLGRTKQTTRG